MPLPQALTITDAAAQRVKDLIAKAKSPSSGLRIGVKKQGCSGLSYVVEYAKEHEEIRGRDRGQGRAIFIDPAATMFLLGSEMDYVEDKFHTGFTFKNPNEKGRCGCGKSFTV